MQGMTEWKRMKSTKNFGEYGSQRWWRKTEIDFDEFEEII